MTSASIEANLFGDRPIGLAHQGKPGLGSRNDLAVDGIKHLYTSTRKPTKNSLHLRHGMHRQTDFRLDFRNHLRDAARVFCRHDEPHIERVGALVIMRNFGVGIDLFRHFVESLWRHCDGRKTDIAAEHFRVPQRPEAAQLPCPDQVADTFDEFVFTQSELRAGVAKGPLRQRKSALQAVDDRFPRGIDDMHQFNPCLTLENTAPRCLKQRVENSTACLFNPVSARRLISSMTA